MELTAGRRSSPSRPKLLSLELGRGIAAFIVLLRHVCVHAFEGPTPVIVIPLPSATAVMFFFVLSGFVMRTSTRGATPSVPTALRFFLDRAKRIYPVYWVVLAATLITWPFLFRADRLVFWALLAPAPWSLPELLRHLVVPQAWTLHWEVFFYCMFGLSLLLRSPRVLFALWLGVILVAPRLPLSDAAAAVHFVVSLLASPLGLVFLTGVAVADLCRDRMVPLGVAVLLSIVGVCLTAYGAWLQTYGLFLPTTMAEHVMDCAGLGCLVTGLIMLERRGALRLGWFSAWAGRVSYSMYIGHWLFIELTIRVMWQNGWTLAPVPFAALLVATATLGGIALAVVIDLPMQRALRWLTRGAQTRQSAGARGPAR